MAAGGEQGKEGEGLISHERIDERRNPPIIARRWSEASGERNQYLVFQGCLRRRLPASERRSKCKCEEWMAPRESP